MGPLLQEAFNKHYAVGAFNMVSLEFLTAVMAAAEARRCPVIINIAEVHFPFIDAELCAGAVLTAAERASVPVALNLDHGLSYKSAEKALALGFTSIMFDGSSLGYDENKRISAEIGRMCRSAGAALEAELGSVGSEGGGGLESAADPLLFTDPRLAGDFVRATGCDALAVAIGNSHGKYRGEPRLDFGRLAEIRDAAGIPLVLHGGSGIGEGDLRRAIGLGIAKINFFTGMSQAALGLIRRPPGESPEKYNDYPQLLLETKNAVRQVVGEQMEIFLNGRNPL
jgi:fructose-bisphosphate aldolase class II